MSDPGLISVRSNHAARATLERLTAALAAKNLTLFAHIDHAAGAAAAGMALRPTDLVIFGNPKGGTPLMQDRQTAGLDLPLKILVWEDAAGQVWLTYSDMARLAARHGLGAASASVVQGLGAALAALAATAAAG
jgi:uncharacterized protein (DUF302 family)